MARKSARALAQFIVICRKIGLFTRPLTAIDGSKFKGVNARDKNFTRGQVRTRLEKLNETIARYLTELDAADRQESVAVPSGSQRLCGKLVQLKAQMQKEGARSRGRGFPR
jgi:transposase